MSDPLSRAEVERVAALAHLALTEDEIALFARQLADILAYADDVRGVDTSGVPPTSHVIGTESMLRDDEPRQPLSNEDALRAAPDAARSAGLFRVPRVMG